MKKHIQILALAALLAGARELTAETVTLVVNTQNPTRHLSIASNQVAEVVSLQLANGAYSELIFQKDGSRFGWDDSSLLFAVATRGGPAVNRPPVQIAGPATFSLHTTTNIGGEFPGAYCTIKITPESTPPDKTIILLAGSKGANIYLEMSTNLFDWSTITPGTFSSATNNLFFRIRAEKLP
ncbi:MAG: hypothetical protein AAB676_14860 [Verrucomicrobiota bacterium]